MKKEDNHTQIFKVQGGATKGEPIMLTTIGYTNLFECNMDANGEWTLKIGGREVEIPEDGVIPPEGGWVFKDKEKGVTR